jgi:hypothetical protein
MRVALFSLLGLGAVLLLAACGGGRCDDGAEDRAQQPPAIAASAAPASSPSVTPMTSAAPGSTPRDLSAALLMQSDVPAGWQPISLDLELENTQPCGQPIPFVPQATAQEQAPFRADRLGPYVVDTVAAYRPGDAARALEATRALLSGCREWKGRYRGRELTFRAGPSAVPVDGLGDEAFAVRLEIDGLSGGALGGLFDDLVRVTANLVVVRRGDLALLLAHAVGGVGNPSPDGEQTRDLAQRAARRLAAVAGN